MMENKLFCEKRCQLIERKEQGNILRAKKRFLKNTENLLYKIYNDERLFEIIFLHSSFKSSKIAKERN